MSNKTVRVQEVKNRFNDALASDISQESKRAMIPVLEGILHATGNYHGFNYVHWLDVGCEQWIEAGRPEQWNIKKQYIGDEYSRFYY